MGQVLTLKDIGFQYGKIRALKGINLQVYDGEILGILGSNGSGKSTLLKIMDGVLKVQEGDIFIRGKSISRLKRRDLAREVAMVGQDNHFRFSFSTLEVVLMGRFPHLKNLQFESENDLRIAHEALRATYSLDLATRSIYELSGGEKQRVLIARALAQDPKVILLDEPTSFLDLKYKREIFRLISSLSKEKGLSVVVVSHDIDLAAQYCNRIAMLKNGSIFQIGDPQEVITASNVEAVYGCPVSVDTNHVTGRPRVSIV